MKRKKIDLYGLPSALKRAETADRAFWMQDAVIYLLMIGFSAIDAVTLSTVFANITFFSWPVIVILIAGCAVALNFIPLIMARFIHCYRYKIKGVKLWMILAMAGTFLVLFLFTFLLRWETRGDSFTLSSAGLVNTVNGQTGAAITTVDEDSGRAVSLTLLLGVLPLITSAINLALGYLNDDPVKRKLINLRYEKANLEKQLTVMHAAAYELNRDWIGDLYTSEQAYFTAACGKVQEDSDHIRALARLALAKKLGTPDSISDLTDTQKEGDGDIADHSEA